MDYMMNLKRILVSLTALVVLLFAASLTLAQEATAVATAATPAVVTAPPGGGLLFLLIGLGAVALISAVWLVRERTETNPESV